MHGYIDYGAYKHLQVKQYGASESSIPKQPAPETLGDVAGQISMIDLTLI